MNDFLALAAKLQRALDDGADTITADMDSPDGRSITLELDRKEAADLIAQLKTEARKDP